MGWYEGPVDPFVATLLVDLRDAVWALKRERVDLKSAIADAVVKMELQKKEITALKEENRFARWLKSCICVNRRSQTLDRLWMKEITRV